MNEFSEFFSQGYWWLSLLGGIHCLGLGLYIRYIYHEKNGTNRILGDIFSLMALYFFTGLLTSDNAPAPIHLLFILIIPVYFLVMPLLYLYCDRSLNDIEQPIGFSRHFYPALIIAILVILTIGFRVLFANQWSDIGLPQPLDLSHLSLFAMLLPALLFIQTGIYFYYIIKMLSRYPGRVSRLHQDSLKDIKFRWLLVLTLALMSNWLIRAALILLPFYFGDQAIIINQAATKLTLLLTVYILAIYGLKQITRAAFLRGKLTRQPQQKKPMQASQQLLSSEELAYLQQLMREDEQLKESKHQ
ncbi:hypothetical protein L2719_13590 [Shewanella schlegeliana]|uniref:Uncharacterized protein n=1 Tax=Shewanella schlegeliana TaxID=190308 RepID=A0ABS1T2K7_9GAMM|nr:hypothetical protein [Shewanella schlegeliana]MBL4915008.1 hypothetical protein [Shewanella schlegeliana]MCL1110580.1 hypothetical protein [Shewanella schlegeliana]GIU32235.1 hypothetical protein TUM4433_24930 [Shewanella schlegeliana]